jgi:hypothetical protein
LDTLDENYNGGSRGVRWLLWLVTGSDAMHFFPQNLCGKFKIIFHQNYIFVGLAHLHCTQLAGTHCGSLSSLCTARTSCSKATDRSAFSMDSSNQWPYKYSIRAALTSISSNSSSCNTINTFLLVNLHFQFCFVNIIRKVCTRPLIKRYQFFI